MGWRVISAEVYDQPGRPMTRLGDSPCSKKSRTILKGGVEWIENFAKEQNITNEMALKLLSDECNRLEDTETKLIPNFITI